MIELRGLTKRDGGVLAVDDMSTTSAVAVLLGWAAGALLLGWLRLVRTDADG